MSLTLKVSDSRTIHKLNSPVRVIALMREIAPLQGVKGTWKLVQIKLQIHIVWNTGEKRIPSTKPRD